MIDMVQDFLTNLRPIINIVAILTGAYVLLLWAASVLWTYRDIRLRSDDISVQVLAVGLTVCLPFAGIPIHLILRPRMTLAEKYERSLEEEYLRRDIEEKYVCPSCQRPIESDFIICPHCYTALRRRCPSCNRVVDLTWSICPYCSYSGPSGFPNQSTSSSYPRMQKTQETDGFETIRDTF